MNNEIEWGLGTRLGAIALLQIYSLHNALSLINSCNDKKRLEAFIFNIETGIDDSQGHKWELESVAKSCIEKIMLNLSVNVSPVESVELAL